MISDYFSRLRREFSTVEQLEDAKMLIVSEGLQLRFNPKNDEELDAIPEVENKPLLLVSRLKRLRHVFSFPDAAISTVPSGKTFCRKGRGELPLSVCRAPHIVVAAARTFAVFTDDYLIIPPRQIGIVSTTDNRTLLKALSLYLSSDFAFYHQFLTASQFGVQRGVATLKALRSIPVPIANYNLKQLEPWVQLHSRLVKTRPLDMREARVEGRRVSQGRFQFERSDHSDLVPLLEELNDLVYDALGFNDRDRALVHDLVNVRLHLNDGKIGALAIRPPKPVEMKTYARRLKSELDGFIGEELDKRNQVGIVYDKLSGMIQIDLIGDKMVARDLLVASADQPTGRELEKTRQRLRKQQSQWVYFDRDLRLYEGSKTLVFKPMQRFHWTESQAMLDASEIIAETLQLGDDSP